MEYDQDDNFLELLELTLTEFIVAYIRAKPNDALAFSVEYFEVLNVTGHEKWDSLSNSVSLGKIHQRNSGLSKNSNSTYNDRYLQQITISRESKEEKEEKTKEDRESKALEYKYDCNLNRIKNVVKQVFMFRSLDKHEMNLIIHTMFKKVTKSGETIVKTGDEGEYFYVIESGIYEAFTTQGIEPNLVKRYDNEGSFGEIALLYKCLRTATIITRTPGVLWCLGKNIFQRVVIKKALTKRKMYERFLRHIPLFKNFNDYEINNIADAIMFRTFEPKEVIIKQGEMGQEMFLIESGEVAVIKNEYNIDREINRLYSGQYFGEISLIYEAPRTATVAALVKTGVLSIDRDSFMKLLGPCIDTMERNVIKYYNISPKKLNLN